MKTPDKIKHGLEIVVNDCLTCDCCYTDCPYNMECHPMNEDTNVDMPKQMAEDALAYIQQLENQIGELTEKVAQFEAAQPKWISVEERLPDDRGNFITKIHCDNGDWIEVNTFDYMEKEWWHDAVNCTAKATDFVTHWMPLPEPPKEDCNE